MNNRSSVMISDEKALEIFQGFLSNEFQDYTSLQKSERIILFNKAKTNKKDAYSTLSTIYEEYLNSILAIWKTLYDDENQYTESLQHIDNILLGKSLYATSPILQRIETAFSRFIISCNIKRIFYNNNIKDVKPDYGYDFAQCCYESYKKMKEAYDSFKAIDEFYALENVNVHEYDITYCKDDTYISRIYQKYSNLQIEGLSTTLKIEGLTKTNLFNKKRVFQNMKRAFDNLFELTDSYWKDIYYNEEYHLTTIGIITRIMDNDESIYAKTVLSKQVELLFAKICEVCIQKSRYYSNKVSYNVMLNSCSQALSVIENLYNTIDAELEITRINKPLDTERIRKFIVQSDSTHSTKNLDYNKKVEIAYGRFNQDKINLVFPNGKEQAKHVILSLARILNIDLILADENQYHELLSIYVDVFIRTVVTQVDELLIIGSLRVNHPSLIKDEMPAYTAYFYIKNNMLDNNYFIDSDKELINISASSAINYRHLKNR